MRADQHATSLRATRFAGPLKSITLAIAALWIIVAGGCGTSQTGSMPGTGTHRVETKDADLLQRDLYAFADRFAAEVAGTASNITWQTKDRRVRELALQWKIQTIPSIRTIVFAQDPRVALFDAWVLCTQQEDYFLAGSTAQLFGEQQHLANEAAQRLELAIEEIARRYVPEDRFDDVHADVDTFAASNPLRKGFASQLIQASDVAASRRPAGIQSLLAIPVSGVSESATAIDRLARMAGIFSEVIEDMPQYVRWQAELLMLEIDSLESVATTRDNFQTFADSAESMAETARNLPGELREQFDQALDSADAKQENLRATVVEARQAIQDLDSAIERVSEVVTAADDTSVHLTETAQAWESTARVVKDLIDAVQPDEDTPDEEAFDIHDYILVAERLESAATELHGLIDDVDSGKLSGTFKELDATSRSSIDHAAVRADELLDHVTRIGLLMIVVLFVGLIASRLLSDRFGRRQNRTDSPA